MNNNMGYYSRSRGNNNVSASKKSRIKAITMKITPILPIKTNPLTPLLWKKALGTTTATISPIATESRVGIATAAFPARRVREAPLAQRVPRVLPVIQAPKVLPVFLVLRVPKA